MYPFLLGLRLSNYIKAFVNIISLFQGSSVTCTFQVVPDFPLYSLSRYQGITNMLVGFVLKWTLAAFIILHRCIALLH